MINQLKKKIFFIICLSFSIMTHAGIFAAGLYLYSEQIHKLRYSLPVGNHLTAEISFVPAHTIEVTLDTLTPHTNRKTTKNKKKPPQGSAYPADTETSNSITLKNITPHPSNPKPHYPFIAREKGLEATCMIQVQLRQDGSVNHVSFIEDGSQNCILCFQKSAIETLKQWRFRIPSTTSADMIKKIIPITFKLVE